MATLFTRTAQNIAEYNENDIQTPDKYKELYDAIPMDVMGIILGYVPLVEFEWNHQLYPLDGSWNINVEWKGRYTYGFWHGGNINICTKPDVIEYVRDVNINCVTDMDFVFPCYSINKAITILQNTSDAYVTIQQGDVYNVYAASQHFHCVYGDNGIRWKIKVPPQLIINELQFIHNTAFNHTLYNINHINSSF